MSARELDALMVGRFPRLTGRSIQINIDSTETMLITSHAADTRRVVPRANITVTMNCADGNGGQASVLAKYGGGGSFDTLFTTPDALLSGLDTQYQWLMDKAEGVYAQAGTWDIVLGQGLSGILAHEAVGHTVESDMVRGGSVASTLRGQRVASPKVSLADYAHTAFGQPTPVQFRVDDEGTVAQDVVLIEDGILTDFMCNVQDSEYVHTTAKGNAFAYSYPNEPIVRMRNTCILPGQDSLEGMIASVEQGYYLLKSSNGQADCTGEFMFGVTVGYEIVNGKLGRAIRDTTVSGLAFDVLKTVDRVGQNVSWDSAGYCGKIQLFGNATGGPALKCRLAIGGR